MSTRFSASWLREVRVDEEAGEEFFEEEELPLWVPSWAREAVDSLDAQMACAEDNLFASLASLTPAGAWLKKRSTDLSASAAVTLEASLEASRRSRYFVLWLLVSVFFFALAVFIGLPVLVLRPQKFALCFTLGSLAFMGSFVRFFGS